DAAAAGGFTGVACMPNTSPVNDSPAITAHILRAAAARPHARVHPIACITQGMAGEALSEYGALQQAGAVALSDDGMPVAHSGVLRRAFQYAQHFDLTVIQHAEDLTLTGEGVMHEGAVSARLGLAGIPSQAEDAMIVRDLMLAEMTGGRYHVAHLATAGGVEAVRAAKARDVDATCEVSPHHLLLTDEAVAASGFDTATKMKPPLRGARDRDALIAGLVDGTIDAIASDHAPHHPNEKEHPFGEAPFGIVGLETTLSLCLDRLVHAGIIDLTRLVALLSTAPARILNLAAGGSLAPGQPADVTLIDLDRAVTVDPSRFRSKGRTTPFAGWTLRGAAVGTLLDGRPVILPPR
ncbi:MAG: dihydroorotase, partial [Acidobacteriota bacterium]